MTYLRLVVPVWYHHVCQSVLCSRCQPPALFETDTQTSAETCLWGPKLAQMLGTRAIRSPIFEICDDSLLEMSVLQYFLSPSRCPSVGSYNRMSGGKKSWALSNM